LSTDTLPIDEAHILCSQQGIYQTSGQALKGDIGAILPASICPAPSRSADMTSVAVADCGFSSSWTEGNLPHAPIAMVKKNKAILKTTIGIKRPKNP
jgi:hypothetical protein